MSDTYLPYVVPISVKGIVFENGKVWLRKNERDEWELPGGKLEEGEQPEETIVREMKEELGFDVEVVATVQAHLYTIKKSSDESKGVLVVSYLCKILGKTGDFELDGEAGKVEFKSFALTEISDLNMPEFYKEAIWRAARPQSSIGVFGIIFDERGRVLLCHRRDYDLWNLPGGGLEVGESPTEGVIREVKEESGLDVVISRLVGIYSKPERNDIIFSFVCKRIGGELLLNDEADRIEYFEIDSIQKNTSPKQVERIRDAVANKGEVIFKTQVGKSSIDLIKEGEL